MSQTTTTVGSSPAVGQKAPELVVVTGKDPQTGKPQTWSLHEAVRNGPVVVAFFPGAYTGTCTKEICNFSDNWSEWAKLGVHFMGVSVDSWHAQKAFAEKNNVKVPLGSDLGQKNVQRWSLSTDLWWGPVSKRATFVVDRQGIIRYANVQTDANAEPNYAEIQKAVQGLH